MKKGFLIIFGIILVVLIIIFVVGMSSLGPIIKKAVNTYGPAMTKTEVALEDVSVSLFSAEARLNGFVLGNPKGFRSPRAVRVASIFVNVDEKSLTGDTVVIDKIEITAPEIDYEKKDDTDNFETILNNVKKSAGLDVESKGGSAGGKQDGKKILIRNFIIKNGKVTVDIGKLGGQSISASLPDIHLRDIGGENGGESPARVFEEILAAIYTRITSSAVIDALNSEFKKLRKGTGDLGRDLQKELEEQGVDMEALEKKLNKFFNKYNTTRPEY